MFFSPTRKEGRFYVLFQCLLKKAQKFRSPTNRQKGCRIFFFDINFERVEKWNSNYLYFHSFWSRDTASRLAEDFELLPSVRGKGRFLGVNVGLNANPIYENYWWGEGEVKMYIDGDKEFPTLVGTGTEDYIGTGWGQGEFFNDYSGCLIANKDSISWAFYRYHVPDPIYFRRDLKVTLQQMGGNRKDLVIALQNKGVPMIPVGIDDLKKVHPLYKKGTVVKLNAPGLPEGFSNFYRSDDVSATAYFYLDQPSTSLPGMQSLDIRLYKLRHSNK